MNASSSRRSPFALHAASASLLALSGLLASASAVAASPGDTWTLTLTYRSEPASPSIGSFTLGPAVAGQPGVFKVEDFSVVIGPPGYAYDYDITGAGLNFDTTADLFGGTSSAHAYTSYGDQFDFVGDAANPEWKTDDFNDPHPVCAPTYCGGFHYGDYSAAAATPAVPEPGSLGMTLAGLVGLALWATRRRAS